MYAVGSMQVRSRALIVFRLPAHGDFGEHGIDIPLIFHGFFPALIEGHLEDVISVAVADKPGAAFEFVFELAGGPSGIPYVKADFVARDEFSVDKDFELFEVAPPIEPVADGRAVF